VSKIMTRNPTFVSSDTSALDALQKMVQGKGISRTGFWCCSGCLVLFIRTIGNKYCCICCLLFWVVNDGHVQFVVFEVVLLISFLEMLMWIVPNYF